MSVTRPFISVVQPVVVFLAAIRYSPAFWLPKLIAEPVPGFSTTVAPVVTLMSE